MTNNTAELSDVRIIGDSDTGGGPFGLVRVVGQANIQDNLICRELKVTGEVKARKDLTSETVRIIGSVEVGKDCSMETAKIVGKMEVGGNCAIQNATITGEVKVVGNWQSNVADVRGKLSVEGQCASEKITVQGSLDVKGLLNFDQAKIRSCDPSKIQELGGRKIEVKKDRTPWMFLKISFYKFILEAQSIEADDIDIDYTTADVVRGIRVKIGKHCRIGKVEYSDSLIVENGADIGEREKTVNK